MHWFQCVVIGIWIAEAITRLEVRTYDKGDAAFAIIVNGLLIWGLIAFWGK